MVAMAARTYHIGQIVRLKPAVSLNISGGVYQVTACLPDNEGEFQYRIKSHDEPHERVARESELSQA
jgi:hypothetical protein